MLTKNVYLLYPAGYSGSYINWAINISDTDLSRQTVKNPLNLNSNTKFGGAGTSHLHLRLPTHQCIHHHLAWVIKNRPETPKVYILNVDTTDHPIADVSDTISQILQHDPDPVFIYINDANNFDVQCYGLLNGIFKWTVFFQLEYGEKYRVDWFNCQDSLTVRNLIAEYAVDLKNKPIDATIIRKIKNSMAQYLRWFHGRNQYHPHEVNENFYVVNHEMPNIYELSCRDVASDRFPTILNDIMNDSQCSSSYSIDYVSAFHNNYIQAQSNLQWFDSIAQWRETGVLDEFLTSHSVIQGLVIRDIIRTLNYVAPSPNYWKELYSAVKDPSWPDCADEEDFILLSESIQQEIINNFGYDPLYNKLANWKTMSLVEINSIYQQLR